MYKRPSGYLLPAFFLLMFLYVLARAVNVYITCDEACSYNTYVTMPVWNTISFNPPIANNHILNTLLMKLSALFSNSELSLRMPNVLAYILYLYSVRGIAGIYFNGKTAYYYCLILVLCLDPAISEFFAYARGYGISIAFMMLGMYQLMHAFAADRYRRHVHIALFSFIVAVSASLVLLNVIPVLWAFSAGIIYHRQTNKNILKALFIPFLYGMLLLAITAYPYYILKVSNELYWGGASNFISDTLAGIMEDIFLLQRRTLVWAVAVVIFLISLLFAFIILLRGLGRNERTIVTLPYYIAPCMLLFCLVLINLQFYFFDVPLLRHRTALFLHPVCMLSLFSAIRLFSEKKARLARLSAYAVSAMMVAGFLVNANLSKSTEWAFNAYDRQVLDDINSATENNSHPTLFVHDFQVHTFRYYVARYHYNASIVECTVKEPQVREDFVYLVDDNLSIVPPEYSLYRSYGNVPYRLFKKGME